MSSYSSGSRKALYKDPDQAKICGVCAGVADFLGLEKWLVRIIAVSFFLFSGGTIVVAYFVANFILDIKPGSKSTKGCFGLERRRQKKNADENAKYKASVKEVWKKSTAPSDALQTAESVFEKIENRLQNMESYVTSNKYQLDKEFDKL
ncbi:MAG: envelope stress response membrane protein PspC [Kangiella sp.]|nr:MAG: envelope stress response membrane protein PspC [Kangiella sp.]